MPCSPRACVCLFMAALAVAIWIYNVSRPGAQADGCPEGCAQNTDRSDGPLRVMSLNMLHGFPRFERLGERLDYPFLLAPPQHRATVASCDRVLDQPPWASGGWLWASDHAGLLAAFCVNQLC
jgi:hypothetical protein